MKINKIANTTLSITLMSATLFAGGCGLLAFRNPEFDNAETGEDGQTYVLDDLEAIADDPDLTDEEKRDALADLGVEDPDLIDALLN